MLNLILGILIGAFLVFAVLNWKTAIYAAFWGLGWFDRRKSKAWKLGTEDIYENGSWKFKNGSGIKFGKSGSFEDSNYKTEKICQTIDYKKSRKFAIPAECRHGVNMEKECWKCQDEQLNPGKHSQN